MPKDIRLDNFGGGPSAVDPKKYIVISLQGSLLTGPWNRAAATLSGFPSNGRWTYVPDADGVMLHDDDGKLIGTLQGLVPGNSDSSGDVTLTELLPFAFASWSLQD
ncbi:hypothetical protein HU751_005160 [Pseudomonas sp. BW13M1]|uniref:Uncharacterized protein n=1 Tax=Pseudomonas peradeniyensis TaxID=2745488 RepID=A0A923GDP5_9PSED|nr:hypothetical protein [Pseudomonas peradeniyensis]MBV4504229.1 hypothetical protein [Pseudomonas peradeniyensis]